MNYRELNGVKDIQVLLQEAGVYTGSIDGKWGGGTADGLTLLFTDYHQRLNGGRTKPLSFFRDAKDPEAAFKGLKDLQSNLKLFNLYTGEVDGIYGTGTFSGFFRVFNNYRAYKRLPAYDIGWSRLVSPAFVNKVKAWEQRKAYFPNCGSALMGCMHFETAGTFSPTIQNAAGAKYFGLVQFGEAAATDLKTTVAEIVKMGQLEQLDLVFKYFEMWERRGKKFTRLEDFYLTIFYPAAVGRKPDEVLFTKDSAVPILAKSYVQNKGFDMDKDGRITIGEINTRIYTAYYDGMRVVNRVPC